MQYTGIDATRNPSGLSISIGFRKYDRDGNNRWMQYATRAEQTPALPYGTLANVPSERREAWQGSFLDNIASRPRPRTPFLGRG